MIIIGIFFLLVMEMVLTVVTVLVSAAGVAILVPP